MFKNLDMEIYYMMETPAPNKRFGVIRGVCSRKVLREFESLSPVRTDVVSERRAELVRAMPSYKEETRRVAFAFPRPNAKPPTVIVH
jgi:hypothetical protein